MKEWLKKRVSVAHVEHTHMYGDPSRGLDPPVPFGFINNQWEALKAKMQDGDELWHEMGTS
jgi:hypothetical protein